MPADRLTIAPADQVADAVRAVLAGHNPAHVAAGCGLAAADLQDAIDAYHTAGTAALEQQSAQCWYHARIAFADWELSERTVATVLGPLLDEPRNGVLTRWWFLRKHPYWRIRLRDADPLAIDDLLSDLTRNGTIAGWQPGVYEPETHAFGGPTGMDIAHELFCADSRGSLDYARRADPTIGRRELSTVLIGAMLAAAGLDSFERGDVFARVAALRPAPRDTDAERILKLSTQLRVLLAEPTGAAIVTSGAPAAFAEPWLEAFEAAGAGFADAARQGILARGARAILTHTVIFHWNRLGLSAATQAILARAAVTAYLPPE